jgi:bacterial/archaeal transporter family-2 protein
VGGLVQILFALLALCAGAGLALQATMNGTLGGHVGRPEWAAVLSYCVGLATLLVWVFAARLTWPGAGLARSPWWTYAGGFLGACYVTVVLALTPRLGVATTLALGVAGQVACAIVLDHHGWLGVPVRPVSLVRMVGAVLLAAGVVLIRR